MARHGDRDEDFGLTPREWLEQDPVPLTPDVDFSDPEQRRVWIRANLDEMAERRLELERRGRGRGRRRAAGPVDADDAADDRDEAVDLEDEADRDDAADADAAASRSGYRDDATPSWSGRSATGSSTTVVALRVQNAEHRALVRLARRESVTVSDLVRRWVRAGLETAYDVDPDPAGPAERERLREALAAAADATAARIADELRRWRELVADAG